MSDNISKNKRYEKYLNRLIEDASQLYVDLKNLLKFYELAGKNIEYQEALYVAPGALYSLVNGLYSSIIVKTSRLFDHNSVDIKKLINFAKSEISKVEWEEKPSIDELENQLVKIEENNSVIDKIDNQRHKTQAHLDKKAVVNLEYFTKNNPLDEIDLLESIELVHEILTKHHEWKYGVTREMKRTNSIDMKTLLETLRVGEKDREENFKSNF